MKAGEEELEFHGVMVLFVKVWEVLCHCQLLKVVIPVDLTVWSKVDCMAAIFGAILLVPDELVK